MARRRPGRRRGARRSVVVGVVALAALVLVGCRPIRYDVQTEEADSAAVWRVRGIETSKGPAVEIRIRHCNTVDFVNIPSDPSTRSFHLHPTAMVKDAAGKVFFNTTGFAGSWVQPSGSSVEDGVTGDEDLQRIVVPVKGAKAPLTIAAECTNYAGYGSGGGFWWRFDPCTTSNRACASRTTGAAELVFPTP